MPAGVLSEYGATKDSEEYPSLKNALARDNAIQSPTKAQDDFAISQALIDIYNRTQRVIVDAAVPGNFVITKSNQAICIDIGQALQMKKQEDDCFYEMVVRQSCTNEAWDQVQDDFTQAVENILYSKDMVYPKTVQMTKALMFVSAHRLDMRNVDFLKKEQDLELLAKAYDAQQNLKKADLTPPEKQQNEQDIYWGNFVLNRESLHNLETLQDSCTQILKGYISSRGSFDPHTYKFNPSGIMHYFRTATKVEAKVNAAVDLMKAIKNATDVGEVEKLLKYASLRTMGTSKKSIFTGWFTRGFEASLGKCMVVSNQFNSPSPEYAPSLLRGLK